MTGLLKTLMNAASKGYSTATGLPEPRRGVVSQKPMRRAGQKPAHQSPVSPKTVQANSGPNSGLKRKRHASAREAAAIESTVKLSVNLLLAIVAGSTLARLVPHYQNQQTELTSLEQAVDSIEQEKKLLWQDFSRNFDPAQAPAVIQEQSGRHDPSQRTIVWVDPLAPVAESK
jgi:hypothetical protein